MEQHGLCGAHPQWWDLPDTDRGLGGRALNKDNRKAIRICTEQCPVKVQCAMATLEAKYGYEHGTIRAGVPLYRQASYLPSERSIKKLKTVVAGGKNGQSDS